MSVSTNGTTNPGKESLQKEYFYALRVEKVVKDGVDKVALNSIFGHLLRQMQNHAPHPLLVSDIHGREVDFVLPIPQDGFQERFAVDIAEGRNQKTVKMGFHLNTITPLSSLKKNMFSYLQNHGIFIRQHVGGFTHGVNNTYLGYIGYENPARANVHELVDRITVAMANYWSDDTQWHEYTRQEFSDNHQNIMTPGGPTIPIVIEKVKHSAKKGDKTVYADVLQVTVPSTHASAAKIFLDGVFLQHKTMPAEFVPAGLRREDPAMYYDLLREQAKWLHQHRNIQVHKVPPTEAPDLKRFLEARNNPAIHRIYIDYTLHRLHISTTATMFSEVQKWVTKELRNAPVTCSPEVATGKSSKTTNSKGKSMYSRMFTTRTNTSDGSFDSTIKTAQPNAWYKTATVPLVIDFSAEAEAFPPLPTKTTKPTSEDAQTATSKMTLTDDTTIKTAIATATQEIEAKYEKKLQDLTTSFTAKLRKLEDTLSKFEAMDSKLDLLLDRLGDPQQTWHTPSASTPTRKTKRRDTKSAPNTARHITPGSGRNPSYGNRYAALQTQDDESNAMEYDQDYSQDDCSATSTQSLGGPQH